MKSGVRLGWLVFALAATPTVHAQFTQQSGVVTGPTAWTEGVTSVDIDGDNDIDVIFANGNGFSSAGTPLAPTILINTGTVGGNPVFVDETATRLPSFTQNGKGVLAFDMDGDGDQDLFFSNGFGKSQRLLRNNGGGFFTDVTASQFTTATMNSFGAAAFDADNDGDRDLALCDNTGAGLFNSGKPRLFFNDGTGVFTEVTATHMPTQTKSSQQNITAVDIDNDLDLDLVLDGRSTPQRLYINDGTGHFSLLNNVIPNGSSSVYETDWADLDGDGDLDGFYISFSGFSEGTAENRLAQTGSLSFIGSTSTISGTNSHDDNELLYLDFDDDGDLDPIVGSLSNNREKLYINNGSFGFTYSTMFSQQSDSTLDLTCGDYDGDGDYDVITAQGESGNFLNRYYRNSGVADTRAPTLVRTDATSVDPQFPFVVVAMVTDATMDDGEQYVTCTLNFTATPSGGSPVNGSSPMRYSGGSVYRGEIDTGLTPAQLATAAVTYTVTMTDGAGNSTTSNAFPIGGSCPTPVVYGVGELGTNGNTGSIGFIGQPIAGTNFRVTVSGMQPTSGGLLFTGVNQGSTNVFWGTLFVSGSVVRTPITTDAVGFTQVVMPVVASMVGTTNTFQFMARDVQAGNPQGSDALFVTWCQ